MERPRDRARHVLGTHRLVDPHGVLAREPAQPAREERLGGEVAPVLLADDDHERRAVDARGGERADGVAEPGRRVQDHERGLAAADRPAGRHAHDRALVQREHEAEVAGRSVSSLISVEPGFAKIDVSPYSRQTSKVASRTVFTATRTAYTAASRYTNHLIFIHAAVTMTA